MAANTYAQRRSLRCRPGATNAQSWYSQIGAAMIRPTQSASFNVIMNGPASSSWVNLHSCPGGVRLQYGFLSRLITSSAKMKPTISPPTMPRLALNRRLRSSLRCSISVIEPSAARSNCVGPRLPSRGITAGARVLLVAHPLNGVDDRRWRRLVVRRLGQRLATVLRVGLLVELIIVGEALRLRLDDPQRATERTGRVRQPFGAEEQDQHHNQDDDVPRLQNPTHGVASCWSIGSSGPSYVHRADVPPPAASRPPSRPPCAHRAGLSA